MSYEIYETETFSQLYKVMEKEQQKIIDHVLGNKERYKKIIESI